MSGKPPNRPRIPFVILLGLSLCLGMLSGFGCAGQFHRMHPAPHAESIVTPPGTVPAIWVSGCWTWHRDHYVWVPRYGSRHGASECISTGPRRLPPPPGFV